jgi:cytochrome c2
MPRFRFASDEVRDIAEYLARDLVEAGTTSGDAEGGAETASASGAAIKADGAEVPDATVVEDGRRTFIRRGCFGCHRLPSMTALAKIGPPLRGIGERPVEPADFLREKVAPTLANWLYLKLRAPERMTTAASLMPTFAIDDGARVGAVLALLSLTNRDLPASRVTRDPPVRSYRPQGAFGAIVSRYRCLSCHQVDGFGGDLSTVSLDRIGSQLQPAYLQAFMLAPATVRVHLDVRMPRMNLTPAEANTIVDHAARVFIDDALEAWSEPDAGARERGRGLYETLGCRACHSIDGQGGYVGPDLSSTGRRLRPGWVQAWLLAPRTWKAATLQPDYGLSATDAQALTAYLMTLTGTDGTAAGARTSQAREAGAVRGTR